MCPPFLLKKSLIDEADRQTGQKSAQGMGDSGQAADFLTGHAEVAQEDCY